MSVINQMLKDLEQRNEQASDGSMANPVAVNQRASSVKIIVLTVIVVMLLNVVGFYLWQLYKENQQLKSEINTTKVTSATTANLANGSRESEKSVELTSDKNSNSAEAENHTKSAVSSKEHSAKTLETVKAVSVEAKPIDTVNQTHEAEPAKTPEPLAQISSDSSELVTNVTNTINLPEPAETELPIKSADKVEVVKPSISISRRQLTADELAQQKMQQAEQAIESNDTEKAEQLLEDILLVQPENNTARKQLAALWYGRQSYQSAINLLSQGIAITPRDQELRLMQAKVYLAQNNHSQAYQVLSAIPQAENTEYQITLATSAQQLEKYDVAINAYEKLVTMQPYDARWHLGLAIVLDTNGQFDLAKASYQMALSNGGLSESSTQFINQRLIELGE